MDEREHPTFERTFTRTFFASWLLCAAGAAGCISSTRYASWDMVFPLSAALLLLGFGGFARLLYRFRHVRCVACGGKTATRKDLQRETWTATCKDCGVVWDLKVGTGSD
jgi:hypothetical protein